MMNTAPKALRERRYRWLERLQAVKDACRAVEAAPDYNARVRARCDLSEAIAALDRFPVRPEWLG